MVTQQFDMIWEFVNIPVGIVNNLLTSTFPGNETLLLFLTSFLIGFFLKKRYRADKIEFVILSMMIFGFLRWLGMGG
tara:strand:+ start:389 stop:619 length:231 start_codon:yes stop_codon:yes gene_type:complete